MNLLHFIGSFHVEVAKRLDFVESAGEANGYMEWVNGKVKNHEVYLLWFPKTGRLVFVIRGPNLRREGEVVVRGLLDAIAHAERIIQQIV